jgi:hypothetical protein
MKDTAAILHVLGLPSEKTEGLKIPQGLKELGKELALNSYHMRVFGIQ